MSLQWKSFAVLAAVVTGNYAAACGSYEDPCQVPLGSYVIATPEKQAPYPAVVFLHGYAAGGYVALSLGEPMLARGYAVIGPDGLNDQNGLASWNLPPRDPAGRNEADFVRQVIEEAANSHDIDAGRVLLAGHSFGGELVSYLACEEPELASAYAPIAGSFRLPLPTSDDCNGHVNLLYTHGWADGDVPLEGRSVWGGHFVQGDVFHAMQVWREVNGCIEDKPDLIEIDDRFLRRRWTTCSTANLEFALHRGGHEIPSGWAEMVLDWFEALP